MSLSDTPANIPAAQAMQAVLERALHPTLLQITDESALHAGHVHARARQPYAHPHCRTGLCMQPCALFWILVCTPWLLKLNSPDILIFPNQ